MIKQREVSPSSSDSSDPIQYESKGEEKAAEKRTVRNGTDRRAKSSLRKVPFWSRSFAQHILCLYAKTDELSVILDLDSKRPIATRQPSADLFWIILWALVPMLIQEVSTRRFGYVWPAFLMVFIYSISHALFVLAVVERVVQLGKRYGTFQQEDFGRDEIADSNIESLVEGMSLGFTIRGLVLVFMCYNAELPSASFSIYYYPKHVAFTLLFDLMFGAWHRTMHNGHRWGMPFLWKVHSLHHSTRRPIATLTILADRVETIFSIVLPAAVFAFVPMTFHEGYLTLLFTVFQEVADHGGVRLHWGNPSMNWIMAPIGCELTSEGHDIHHRKGMDGVGYGQLTMFWDRLFGTKTELIETKGMRF